MLKFFRRIRHALLSDRKFSNYLIYALGEIFLVMIGILLALQVNNWNENRKLKAEEFKLLKELRKDVSFSVTELDTVAYYNQKSVDYIQQIQQHLRNDLPYSTVLDTAFGNLDIWHQPYLPFAAYETIKTKGIDRIQNDSLKAKIIRVYEFGMKILLEDNGAWEWSFNQNTTQRMMINNIRRSDDLKDGNARPNDYEALKKNVEFGNFINVLHHLRDDHVLALSRMSVAMQELLVALDNEIADRS